MTSPVHDEAVAGAAAHRPDVAASAGEPIRLAEVLDRAEAVRLLASLIERRGHDLAVDASAVRRVGGQCLQVLMSAAATWSRDAVPFAVAGASQEFVAGVALFGVDAERLSPCDKMNGAG